MLPTNRLRHIEGLFQQSTQLQQQLQQYFRVTLDLLCVLQTDGTFVALNSAWNNILGWEVERCHARNWVEWMHAQDVEKSRSYLKVVVNSHIGSSFPPLPCLENRMRDADGYDRWLSWQMTMGEDGLLYAVVKVISVSPPVASAIEGWHHFRDDRSLQDEITCNSQDDSQGDSQDDSQGDSHRDNHDHHQCDKSHCDSNLCQQMEDQLHDSESRLAEVQRMGHLGHWEFDVTTQSLIWSLEIFRIYGLDHAQPEPTFPDFLERLHPEDRAIFLSHVNQSIAQGTPCQFEHRIINPDGTIRYIEVRGRTVLDEQGQVVRLSGIAVDVTERKQVETATQRREQEFRALIEHAPDAIMRLDRSFRYVYVNPITEHWLGRPARLILGKTSQDLGLPDALVDRWHLAMQRVLKTGREQILEYELPSRQGIIYAHARIMPEMGNDRLVQSLLMIARDVTELKQAALVLHHQAEQERLIRGITQRIRQSLNLDYILNTTVAEVRYFLKTDRVVIYRFFPDWSGEVVVEAIEPHCRPILGQVIQDACFQSQWYQSYQQGRVSAIDDVETSALQPCHRALLVSLQVRANLVVPILQGQSLWGLLIAHHCTGSKQWRPSDVSLLKQLAEQVAIAIQQSELYQQVRLLNTNLENQVQERTAELRQALEFEALLKRITDKVRDSLDEQQILQTAVRELGFGLDVYSCDTGLYDLEGGTSTICCEYVCTNVSSAIGKVITMSDHPEIYEQLLQGQPVQHCQLEPGRDRVRANAAPLTILACPIIDDQGVIGDLWLVKLSTATFDAGAVRIVQQVANQCAIAIRQARLYQATQAQVTELERLNRLKDDFLSTVSHELRTPISNVKMAIEMLEIALQPLGVLEQTRDIIPRYLRILQEESQREMDLINDLLDLSRLDADTEPLVLTTIDPDTWILHIIEPFLERIQQQQQHLMLDIPTVLPPLTTDLLNLERILSELLNNACKYTPMGEWIRVTVRVIPTTAPPACADQSREQLQICISNTGVDVPAAECDRIFDKFYRIPNQDPWKHGGTGLGLALVKKLVERLQGTIHVESQNRSITFCVQIPLQLAIPSPELAIEQPGVVSNLSGSD